MKNNSFCNNIQNTVSLGRCQWWIDKFRPGEQNYLEAHSPEVDQNRKSGTKKINTDQGPGCNLTLTPHFSLPLCVVNNNFP